MIRVAGGASHKKPLPLNNILPGRMMLQNFPSVCVAHALDPRPGDVVLDMCAAPRGKTTHAASLIDFRQFSWNLVLPLAIPSFGSVKSYLWNDARFLKC
mmetsp:Transcript_1264/g.3143  ORF Transcript_1264/g.3143 Transcript_1264/m.3143 type:complete len:99 (-) Transcript_1264:58-354(-)